MRKVAGEVRAHLNLKWFSLLFPCGGGGDTKREAFRLTIIKFFVPTRPPYLLVEFELSQPHTIRGFFLKYYTHTHHNNKPHITYTTKQTSLKPNVSVSLLICFRKGNEMIFKFPFIHYYIIYIYVFLSQQNRTNIFM